MEFLVLAVLIGLIPAAIARNKGRSFVGWWIYGALLFIVALPHSLLMGGRGVEAVPAGPAPTLRPCPSCAEMIQPAARICRFCGREV
jgi:hypothetical protein